MIAAPAFEQPMFDVQRLVRGIRKARRWTQASMAAQLNVSAATIAAWEHGRSQPNVRDMPLLRALLLGWSDVVSSQLIAIGEIERSARAGELTPQQAQILKQTLERTLSALVEHAQ